MVSVVVLRGHAVQSRAGALTPPVLPTAYRRRTEVPEHRPAPGRVFLLERCHRRRRCWLPRAFRHPIPAPEGGREGALPWTGPLNDGLEVPTWPTVLSPSLPVLPAGPRGWRTGTTTRCRAASTRGRAGNTLHRTSHPPHLDGIHPGAVGGSGCSDLPGDVAAVDDEFGSGHERGFVRGQEQHNGGGFLGLTCAGHDRGAQKSG